MLDETRYYDAAGKQIFDHLFDMSLVRSKVICKPHNFKFYIKKEYKSWFGFGKMVTRWDYSHTSSTFGSWMWPEGLPLRFDGVCNYEESIEHAHKIGSNWKIGCNND